MSMTSGFDFIELYIDAFTNYLGMSLLWSKWTVPGSSSVLYTAAQPQAGLNWRATGVDNVVIFACKSIENCH